MTPLNRLGVKIPIVQAPMAGVSAGALARAVSAAGALGFVGVPDSASASWVAEAGSAV